MLTALIRSVLGALILGPALPARAQEPAAPDREPAPAIQLAILLDTSGSMEGLISQAKTQVWSIVNEMTRARMEGRRSRLRVALYEYGKSTIPASEGYLRQILPLTDDLDEVSAQLFALTTNGGEEYCGRVIRAATKGLAWSESSRDLRVLVIAGNEPFTQGDVDFRGAVRDAVERGLIVNTIFCGDETEGARTGWKDGALLGEGTYGSINQAAVNIHIEAPQDAALSELGARLNETYLAYGEEGEKSRRRQMEQDLNAAGAGAPVAAQRAAAKGSDAYLNSGWDLLDGVRERKIRLEEVRDENLPESMRGKPLAEKQRILDEAAARRADLRKQIGDLNAERARFVAAKAAEDPEGRTLGAALVAAMRSQAERRGFAFAER